MEGIEPWRMVELEAFHCEGEPGSDKCALDVWPAWAGCGNDPEDHQRPKGRAAVLDEGLGQPERQHPERQANRHGA